MAWNERNVARLHARLMSLEKKIQFFLHARLSLAVPNFEWKLNLKNYINFLVTHATVAALRFLLRHNVRM